MSDCKIYPADTVDIYGDVWPTVGENIRNGLFGENVKVGYVNINKGKVTSTDFIINDIYSSNFRIENINCFLVFTESISTKQGITISFANLPKLSIIYTGAMLSDIIATIKIIYKDVL